MSCLEDPQHLFGTQEIRAALHSDAFCFPASVAMGRAAVCSAGVPVSAALEQRSVGSSQHQLRPSMSPVSSAHVCKGRSVTVMTRSAPSKARLGALGGRRPYRWWKDRSLVSGNTVWGKPRLSWSYRVRACSVEEAWLRCWWQDTAKQKALQERFDAVLAAQRSKGMLAARELRLQRVKVKQEEEHRIAEARAARGK